MESRNNLSVSRSLAPSIIKHSSVRQTDASDCSPENSFFITYMVKVAPSFVYSSSFTGPTAGIALAFTTTAAKPARMANSLKRIFGYIGVQMFEKKCLYSRQKLKMMKVCWFELLQKIQSWRQLLYVNHGAD